VLPAERGQPEAVDQDDGVRGLRVAYVSHGVLRIGLGKPEQANRDFRGRRRSR
jgi:hypothetical protein